MKKEKERIDELIKETLTEEEAKFYDDLEERNLIGKIGDTFKGPMGWLVIVMNIVNLIFFGLFIYCVYALMNTDQTNEIIRWALAAATSFAFMGFIKLYVWMQMNRNDILRELKRLELQVATLSSRHGE